MARFENPAGKAALVLSRFWQMLSSIDKPAEQAAVVISASRVEI
jgi:hypothetical protein